MSKKPKETQATVSQEDLENALEMAHSALRIAQKAIRETRRQGAPVALWDDVEASISNALFVFGGPNPVAWRSPGNMDPGQSVTFDRARAAKWSHIYRQPLFDEPLTALEEPVAWRDPSNMLPEQSVTFQAEVAYKWPHKYRQALYARVGAAVAQDADIKAPSTTG